MENKRTSEDKKIKSVKDTLSRFLKMDSARSDWESEWHYSDIQSKAQISTNAQGKLIINISLEKVLNEINRGKYGGVVNFDIIGGQDNNDVAMTQPIYYALQDYLDREGFWQQKSAGIHDKGQYGTMIMQTGIRYDAYTKYEPKEVFDGIYSDDNKQAIKRIEYKYCPTNQSVYTSRFDDQAMNQRDYRKAEDCITEEQMTVDQAKQIRGYVNGIDINDIKPYAISDPVYGKYNAYPNQCIIWQKHNRITGDRDIILNRTTSLYSGKYYHNGELPLSVCQHFPNNDSLCGDGIPKRIRGLKGYKKSILQDILDASKMSAGINLIVPQNTEVKGRVTSGLNVWETNATGTSAVPVQFQTRIADMAGVITIIDDLINVEAGENIRAPYSSPKTTLGEIQIMEEHQQLRDRSIDESLNIFYDDILTKTAINLTKYAVSLEKKVREIMVDGENVREETFPNLSIKVKNSKVEDKKMENKDRKEGDPENQKEKNIKVFRQSFGDVGYFDLDKSMCKGEFLVKVVTPSTRFSSATQQNAFTQAIGNLNTLAQIFASLGINITDEIRQEMNPMSIIDRFKQLYNFDTALVAKTKKSEIEDSNREQEQIFMELTQNSLSPNPDPNAQVPASTTTPTPSATPQSAPTETVPTAKPVPSATGV